jgi:endonuclease-3
MEEKRIEDFERLLAIYGKRKHPLEYRNRYQLLVMTILSGGDSDKHINSLAPALFEAYPTLRSLAAATPQSLLKYIRDVKGGDVANSAVKAEWLITIAKKIGDDERIPTRFAELTAFQGIGPKTANVIIRESGGEAEGVIVDLHVVRVAPRIGVAEGKSAATIERKLKAFFPQDRWNEIGMAISFLGREICRPTSPKCDICPVASICDFYASIREKLSR